MASVSCDPSAPSQCDQCGNAAEDTIRCTVQDNKSLCEDCFQGLPEARREDIGDPEWVCDKHFNQKVEVFCKTCQCGACKDCAGDLHKDHDVVSVIQLVEELRRDLREQLQEVGVRVEELSQSHLNVANTIGKIEAARRVVDKVVDEIKKEIELRLEEDIQRINLERDVKLHLARKRSWLDRQRIEVINLDMTARLLKDEEPRKRKIQRMESNFLVSQDACKSASEEITNLLESSPENIIIRGRQLSSVAKASSAFQCPSDVVNCCREVELHLPKLKENKRNFYEGQRPLALHMKLVIYMLVILYLANAAKVGIRDGYNSFLSSGSMTDMVSRLLNYLALNLVTCCLLMILLIDSSIADCPFTWQDSLIKILKICKEMVLLALEFGVFTAFSLILLNSPLYIFQFETVSETTFAVISLLHICSFFCFTRFSKRYKDILDYVTGPCS